MSEVTMDHLRKWEENCRVIFATKNTKFKGKEVIVGFHVRLGRHYKIYEVDIDGDTVFSSGETSTALWHYNRF